MNYNISIEHILYAGVSNSFELDGCVCYLEAAGTNKTLLICLKMSSLCSFENISLP